MSKFSDISVVIHGPVNSLPNRSMPEGITKKTIDSVRTHLPGAKVILSTWEGQDTSNLFVDELVLNQDPGSNTVAFVNSKPLSMNYNRQIVATKQGLKKVSTPYAIKLRSDNYITHSGFVGFQKAFPNRAKEHHYFKERVVIPHRFSLLYSTGFPIRNNLCDFFAYGLTQDLLLMWDIPLFEDFNTSNRNLTKEDHPYFPLQYPTAEQLFTEKWMQKCNKNFQPLQHKLDCSKTQFEEFNKIIANNFVILNAYNLGLHTPARLKSERIKKSEISFFEWQCLYQKYCNKNYIAPSIQYYLNTECYRKVKYPIDRLLNRIGLKKRKTTISV